MKIIDILKDSAQLLGLTKEVGILESVTEDSIPEEIQTNENIVSLFNLVNFSIRELCTNYVPVLDSVLIQSKNCTYPLNSLENFIRIQNVYKDDNLIKFKIINRNLVFEEDGVYQVCYKTYPKVDSLFTEIDFLQSLSPDVIVFGLCAYYSLANGLFNEFKEFHDKYLSQAESLKELKFFEIPSRRWEWEQKRLLK